MTVPAAAPSSEDRATSRAATLRLIVPNWRSRFRTPASRVCSAMMSTQRRVSDLESVVREPVLVHLARKQVLARDMNLLLFGVAGERNDLHAVEERWMDCPELIRRRNEQYPRKVERHLQVVVAKRVVLRRVEHLEERRGRIALDSRPKPCRSRPA